MIVIGKHTRVVMMCSSRSKWKKRLGICLPALPTTMPGIGTNYLEIETACLGTRRAKGPHRPSPRFIYTSTQGDKHRRGLRGQFDK